MVSQIGPLPIQTIVRFFAFCVIALGIIFMAEASYSLFSLDSINNKDLDSSVPVIEFAKDRK